jgi:hypothetical protein
MDQLSVDDMRTHVPVLGWVLIVSSALLGLVGLLAFVILIGVGAISGDRNAFAVLGFIGAMVAGLLVLLAAPGVLAGIGLLRRANWGRVLAIIVAALGLLNFPIGTVIGVYALWVLFQSSAEAYFAPYS